MEVLKVSKKRGILPALSELTNFNGKKKKDVIDDGRKMSEVSDDELDITDTSTTSTSTDTGETGSSCDDVNKVSRKQRTFAKMSVRRDKKKEKEKREKIDKNRISMEDFLSKQSEFYSWLEDEKNKCIKNMSSPKLKTHFKAFMKLWNKRKLPLKYYRGSTDIKSPCPVHIPRVFSFDEEEETFDIRKYCKPKSKRLSIETNNVLSSPFSTFGKTPPKLQPVTSLQKLSTHREHVCQNETEELTSPTDSHEQIFGDYQIPVRNRLESSSDQEGNKENISSVGPYVVTAYPWVKPGNKEPVMTSDHSSSSSSHSNVADDFPVYAQPDKSAKNRNAMKSANSIPCQNSPPPIPPPPKYFGDETGKEQFSSPEEHYKSVEMDLTLPPPPPIIDQSVDEALLNATLPPPPTNNSINNFDDNLPSPPGYAEIKCPDSIEGEWKPPSTSKIYSPRKFKLTKSTSTEQIYSEIPPPVAPKPKRNMFFGSVYKSEEDMYIEMNSVPETPVLYSDYAIPADVPDTPVFYSGYAIPADVPDTPVLYSGYAIPADVIDTNEQVLTQRSNQLSDELERQGDTISDNIVVNNGSNSNKGQSVPMETSQSNLETNTVEPFIFRTSGKGCSDVLGGLGDNDVCIIDPNSIFPPHISEINKEIHTKTLLETDIDSERKKMKRTKSAETIIW